MLNSISWQQYITAVLLLSATWYAYVALRYYQKEITAFFRIRLKKPYTFPAVANQMTVVMGKAKPESDTGVYEPDELVFCSVQPDDISDQTIPKGPSDDLFAEAQVLIEAYSDNDDKAGFLSLFKLLLEKYDVFADEISLPQVIKVLPTSKLPFSIQADEWPQTFAA